MLILTRRIVEFLVIGDDTKVGVLGVKGNQVRIGIAAPKAVNIVREELLDDLPATEQGLTRQTPPA